VLGMRALILLALACLAMTTRAEAWKTWVWPQEVYYPPTGKPAYGGPFWPAPPRPNAEAEEKQEQEEARQRGKEKIKPWYGPNDFNENPWTGWTLSPDNPNNPYLNRCVQQAWPLLRPAWPHGTEKSYEDPWTGPTLAPDNPNNPYRTKPPCA
jgi:hypothetical protein